MDRSDSVFRMCCGETGGDTEPDSLGTGIRGAGELAWESPGRELAMPDLLGKIAGFSLPAAQARVPYVVGFVELNRREFPLALQ